MAMTATSAIVRAQQQAWQGRILGMLLLSALAMGIYMAATYHSTVIKKEQPISMLMPVEAPPPPPPPPLREVLPQVTEPMIEQPIIPQEATQNDNAITQNTEVQIGGDAFGIGAGSGNGMRGSGIAGMLNRGPYGAYMAKEIREAIREDVRLQSKHFKVSVSLWLTAAGKIERAVLRTSTGAAASDEALKVFLTDMPAFDKAPPQSVLDSLPVNMTINVSQSL